jgi:hypothetical protein
MLIKIATHYGSNELKYFLTNARIVTGTWPDSIAWR